MRGSLLELDFCMLYKYTRCLTASTGGISEKLFTLMMNQTHQPLPSTLVDTAD